MRSVIAPLDGSVAALAALPVARAYAAIEKATLHLVYISDPALPPQEALARMHLGDADVEGTVVDTRGGSPAAGIVEITQRRQGIAVVMCPHVGHPHPGRALGSVADGVLHAVRVPVVLVRPERGTKDWRPRKVLLPLDGTPLCARAIDPAAELAARIGASVVLLHVAGPDAPRAAEPGTFAAPAYMDQPQHEWPAWADEFTQRMVCRAAQICTCEVRVRLLTGQPGREILRFAAAEEVDLIVMAWRGTLEEAHAATFKTVVRGAPCPVMVLRVA